MIPEDREAQKEEQRAAEEKLQQTQVNDHFKAIPPEERPEPYSDDLFRDTAIQWLIATDQVCFLLIATDQVCFLLMIVSSL